jgi:hypothetical protein
MATGVNAEGIRSAKATSIWERKVDADGMYSPYVRLKAGSLQTPDATKIVQNIFQVTAKKGVRRPEDFLKRFRYIFA